MRDEELREVLAGVLCDGGHCGTCKRRATELLPVVRRYADQRAAEELRKAAALVSNAYAAFLDDYAEALTREATT